MFFQAITTFETQLEFLSTLFYVSLEEKTRTQKEWQESPVNIKNIVLFPVNLVISYHSLFYSNKHWFLSHPRMRIKTFKGWCFNIEY